MRRTLLALALLLGSVAPLARAELTVGATRTAQPREGLVLREEPRGLSKKLRVVAYGTQVKVVEVKDLWAKVDAPGGGPGWARASELVEPSALTGAAAYRGTLSSADVTAAGRQFDARTERTYRTMDPKVDPAYPIVDQIEKQKPTEAEVEAFIAEGKLGGPEGRAAVVAAGGLATAPRTDEYGNQLRPVTDEDFVNRLSMNFSPEQEYYVGRSVAARAIAEFGLDPDVKRQALVKKTGAALIALCDRVRQTYGGYHFAVLNCPEANGIAGPGGFILVTSGALDLARSEDELAGILAHEISHVSRKHGEAMIRKSREWEAQMAKLRDAAEKPPKMRGECGLCAEMAKTLGVASQSLVGTLNKDAYARDFEFQADLDGSLSLLECGYRVSGVADYLEVLPKREHARWTTHPASAERIAALKPLLDKYGKPVEGDEGVAARKPRFVPGSATAPAKP
jgi:hypothetical protein